MSQLHYQQQHILIAGNQTEAASLTVCLLQAGQLVTVYNTAETQVLAAIQQHLKDVAQYTDRQISPEKLHVTKQLHADANFDLVIALTRESITEKVSLLQELESKINSEVPIAVNTDTFSLSTIQQYMNHPQRVFGANWAEPVHTTCFLEIITNAAVKQQLIDAFYQQAKLRWEKDPYIITTDKGIRTRLLTALMREAFYLVENNYVTVEDIDRACRNDAGYYMPFAGNFRYMDLMGTYMYGIVMQDLNPELSKDTHIPQFCRQLIDEAAQGMANNKGFYNYEPGEVAEWSKVFRRFSYQIQQVMQKYPFNYQQQETLIEE